MWKLEKVKGQKKPTKVPYQVNGEKADSTDSKTWTSYSATWEHEYQFDGIGFVLTEGDPYTVIDLDDCIENGEIKPEAQTIINTLDSYTEYSQSGNGIHIFIKGKKPGKRSKNTAKSIEIYDSKRFIVVTRNHVEGTPTEIHDRQDTLNYLYDMYFPDKEDSQQTEHPSSPSSPLLEDDEVINIALKAKNGQQFKKLYTGDFSAYGSQSEADQALCNYLAFYTQEPEQIDRLFSKSGLYREKWDRQDYKSWTINKAINGLQATYNPVPKVVDDFKQPIRDAPDVDLKKALTDRHFDELARMQQEWEDNGRKGRKPTTISPVMCSVILPEYVSFVLFDLEENTRLAMYMPDEGIYTRNTTVIKRVISWLEPKLNSTKADEVIYHLTNKAKVKEKTDSRYLIPVKNGVFNLKTKQLEPFSPEYVFTTKIATPYKTNPPNPILDGWDVESWLYSIASHDKEIVHLLWQVINDSLNGNYTRRKAIFLIGDGNNGKGTFQELLTNLIGFNNIATLKVHEFDERFRLSVLEGKTAVIGDDVPVHIYIDDSSNFNSVVTGDIVSVEMKNKPIYHTVFKCTVIQSTNGMPKFKNKTNGTIRRLIIVPFNADFTGAQENTRIKESYIKNPRVLEYVLHKAIHMDFEKFNIPTASLKELETFKQDNDPVLEFKVSVFDEWNVPEVPKFIVYEFYKKFCMENGYRHVSNRHFHKQFRTHLGKEWDADSNNRFRYDSLLKYIGDLDELHLGFGFPDQKKKYSSYKNTRIKAV